jgi:hypothetical protein
MKTLALSANGEGFGHVARMVAMVPALAREYRLVLYAPAQTHSFLREKLPGVASGDIPLRDIPCLTFAKHGDRIDYRATVRRNAPIVFRSRTLVRRLRNRLAADGVDFLVSDFEPFVPWAARSLGIPVLQLNHPGIVIRSPSILPDALAAKCVASLMMGPWDRRLFVSFYDGDSGPMVRDDIRSARGTECDGSVVVYLKPGYRKPILLALKKLGVTNYRLFPDPTADYAKALASCKAVIAGGGHQTICEALYLGKPILAIPQRGQYEQRLNASMLDAGGYGTRGRMRNLTAGLGRFLADVDSGSFPKASRAPWTVFRVEDSTALVVDRINAFTRDFAGHRPLPFRTRALGDWLGPMDTVLGTSSDPGENWDIPGGNQWRA